MTAAWLQVVVAMVVLVACGFPATIECRIRNYKFNVCGIKVINLAGLKIILIS